MIKKAISIIHPSGYLDTVPCMMSAIELLSRAGYSINILMSYDERFSQPKVLPKNVKVFILHHGSPYRSVLSWLTTTMQWVLFIFSKCRDRHVCFIGMDAYGLFLSTVAGKLKGVKRVYFSLELLISRDINKSIKGRMLKGLERWANKSSVMTIIQDETRGKELVNDNRINNGQIVIVPNCSLGSVTREKHNFWREKFGIATDRKIIVIIGEICERNCSLGAIESAKRWPREWQLIVHSREKVSGDLYFQKVLDAAKEASVIVSTTPLPFEELYLLTTSADIGLALYDYIDPAIRVNIETTGLSSGKLAMYLQAGLPVVVTGFGSFKELVQTYNCGVAIDTNDNIQVAIEEIFRSYDSFREGAFKAFEKKFDFDGHFQEVLNRLEKIEKKRK